MESIQYQEHDEDKDHRDSVWQILRGDSFYVCLHLLVLWSNDDPLHFLGKSGLGLNDLLGNLLTGQRCNAKDFQAGKPLVRPPHVLRSVGTGYEIEDVATGGFSLLESWWSALYFSHLFLFLSLYRKFKSPNTRSSMEGPRTRKDSRKLTSSQQAASNFAQSGRKPSMFTIFW